MAFADATNILLDVAETIRPPKRLSVVEGAEQNVRLATPGGYEGPYRVDQTPYMAEPMNSMASRQYESVIFAGPARSGKSQGLIDCFTGYFLTTDPGDAVIVMPTETTARYFAKARIDRMLRNSPNVKKVMSRRSADDNVAEKRFLAGNFLVVAHPTVSQASSREYRYVMLSDLDRMDENLDGEGSPFELFRTRTKTFLSRGMTMAESSPGYELLDTKFQPRPGSHEAPPTRGILGLYNRGTRARWQWPCPECTVYFEGGPGLSALQWDDPDEVGLAAAARSVVMPCTSCGAAIPFEQRRDMNAKGVWVHEGQYVEDGVVMGDRMPSNSASYWMHGTAAAFNTWESLVLRYLQAMQAYESTGDLQPLKVTINTDQGAPFTPPSKDSGLTLDALKKRAQPVSKRVVPDGVRMLTAAADVQGNRFVVQVHGWGEDNRCWLIDRFDLRNSDRRIDGDRYEQMSPHTHPDDWNVLDKYLLNRRYPLENDPSLQMGISMAGVDMHGMPGVTQNALNYWRKDKSSRFVLLRGNNTKNAPPAKLTYPDTSQAKYAKGAKIATRGDVPVLQLHTDRLKDAVFASLSRGDPGPNYIQFPDWLSDDFFAELIAEERDATGKWRQLPKRPNEAFDLCGYNYALAMHAGVLTIDWSRPPPHARLHADGNPLITTIGDDTALPKRMNFSALGQRLNS